MRAELGSARQDSPGPPTGLWASLPLARKLEALIGLVLIAAIAAISLIGAAAADLDRALAARDRDRAESALLADLQTALLNVETGQRGYALSGERRFLEPYTLGWAEAERALVQLGSTTAFPGEVAALAADARAYLDEFAGPSVAGVRAGVPIEAIGRRALLEEGKARFDRLRRRFATLAVLAARGFEASRTRSEAAARTLSRLPLAVLAAVGLGLLGLRVGLGRLVLGPLERLRRATVRLAGGDYGARVPVTSADEVGELARTFNATAAALGAATAAADGARAALEARTVELSRSNEDLEQFAYVASHDLQEPLRMVSSYTQLLARRYQGKLDERADQYITFAVDGANRMGRLINDLLAYSRVGTHGGTFEPTDLGAVLAGVLLNLTLAVEDSGATVSHDPLPVVVGDRTQLNQLFQNLIGNALKFRGEAAPRVRVSAEPEPVAGPAVGAGPPIWHIVVSDNGIGIEPQYFERIFVIFQRLHAKTEYPGSGIGLAICKKIVERHGGRMWLISTPGQGSAFHFTLPAAPASQKTP